MTADENGGNRNRGMTSRRRDARVERGAAFVAAVVLLVACVRVAIGYGQVSATVDEATHIAAGLEWLQHGRYTLQPENPPLSRVPLAVGPFLAGYRVAGDGEPPPGRPLGDIVDTDDPHDLSRARAGNLVWLLAAGAVVYAWARRLHGPWPASLAVFFFVCVPTVLAHAGLATTDIACAAAFCAALLAFTAWLDGPTWARTILLGVCTGGAL